MASRDAVLKALAEIKDPATGTDIVASGMVRALQTDADKVRFVLEVPEGRGPELAPLQQQAETAIRALGLAPSIVMTAHAAPKPPPELKAKKPAQGPIDLPDIGAIIAVASGKGGVGKSTLSANLAVAMALEGKRVGLLDADVYGPSQPRMLGVTGRPSSPDGKTILPLRNHGVTLMSIGLMLPEDEAVVWRGPMLMGALQQMLGQVAWGPLDVLIVDLPPGTGDVQITLAQKAQLKGAVIVSTPQDIALLDARKALAMFRKVDVPILGMIENMATHICSKCGHEDPIFGSGGAEAEAERHGLDFLGKIPLDRSIREAGDSGAPVVLADPQGGQAAAFRAIAQAVLERL